MDKHEIADVLEEIATLLELKGDNPFRVRAYRNGARALRMVEEDLATVIAERKLTDYEGIGEHLSKSIETLFKTGKLADYEALRRSTPAGLLELIRVPGLGPKKVKALYEKLHIHSIEELKQAAGAGKIAKLKGFGPKTEKNILHALEHLEAYQKRYLWWDAWEVAEPLLAKMKKIRGVKRAEICGSLRRGLETVGDLDFVVGAEDPTAVIRWFTARGLAAEVLAKGETKASIRLQSGMQADLRVVPVDQFVFAVTYFTGSKEHTIKIRTRSLKQGWSLSEYGFEAVKKRTSMPKIADEAGLYRALGLSYIPPELREERGEIEAAEKGRLPVLIEEEEIRGTLHNHTTASDGRHSLKEMAKAAEELGWEYLGISDHSKSSFQANGLSEEKLLEQLETIHKLNSSAQFKIRLLAGSECDILPNGALDYPNSLLKQLDFVIASVHSSLRQDEKTMTRRIIKALENPWVTMLGHPTGRLLLQREAYAVDLEKVIDAAIANGKIIELNGNPTRLDLDWRFWRAAAKKGLKCCINCDAHAIEHLPFYHLGVKIARKGWLTKRDVINTLPLREMLRALQSTRPRSSS